MNIKDGKTVHLRRNKMCKLFNSQFARSFRKSDASEEANIGLAGAHPSSKATDVSSASPRQLLPAQ